MQIAPPPDFVIYVQKWAFCGLQNTPKSVFGRGSAADPAGGAHEAPPDPLVGCRRDTPPIPCPTRHGPTFGARHASPQKSSQIYAYGGWGLLLTDLLQEHADAQQIRVCVTSSWQERKDNSG